MDRSLVRISSLFLIVIVISHIVLATNARVISSLSFIDKLAVGTSTNKISTTLMGEEPTPLRGEEPTPLMGEEPTSALTMVQEASESYPMSEETAPHFTEMQVAYVPLSEEPATLY